MSTFEKNYEFFKNNFTNIVKNKLGKFVVVCDEKVVGYYNSTQEAIADMQKKGKNIGDFIVQECTKNINDIMAVYYSTSV